MAIISTPQCRLAQHRLCDHRAFVITAITTITAAFLVSPALGKVIGNDDRIGLPIQYSHLQNSIGQIVDTTNNFRCTAFCVSENTIATNAHCLAWGVKQKYQQARDVRNFTFRLLGKSSPLRWQNITPLADPYLSTLVLKPKNKWHESNYVDWTAARLQNSICAGNALKLASNKAILRVKRRGGVNAILVGYHRDRFKLFLSFQKCPLGGTSFRHGNAIAGHTCDTASWASGGPMFIDTADGLRVVAIHRGGKNFKRPVRLALGSRRKKSWKFLNIAVLPIQLKKSLPAFVNSTFIDKKLSVAAIQKRLKARGFFKARPDGKVSAAFIRAINNYQKSIKQKPIGMPTAETLLKLGFEEK